MAHMLVDADQIAIFVNAMLRYASPGQTISLRSFVEGTTKPHRISAFGLDQASLQALVLAAVAEAQSAANADKPVVFCPPIAGFVNETQPWRAREQDLNEAFALSVECDAEPGEARKTLERLLGRATVVVASGGEWIDPVSGEVEPKLHLHWRLNEPAIGEDLQKLKEARRLATELAGGDPSNVPMVHPIRWPGSWHRKGEPRLATIIQVDPDREIDLVDVLDVLHDVSPCATDVETTGERSRPADQTETPAGDDRSTPELIANIMSGREYHPSLVPLAARLLGQGMYAGAVVKLLRGCMEAVPPRKAGKRVPFLNRINKISQAPQRLESKTGMAD